MYEQATEPMTYGEKVDAINDQIHFADSRIHDAIYYGTPDALAQKLAFWYGRITGLRFGLDALSFEKPKK